MPSCKRGREVSAVAGRYWRRPKVVFTVSGAWTDGKRHGQGICHFADGRLFRGEWQEDSWLQSEAEPALCRVRGPGTAQATSGNETTLTISVRLFLSWTFHPTCHILGSTSALNGSLRFVHASLASIHNLHFAGRALNPSLTGILR